MGDTRCYDLVHSENKDDEDYWHVNRDERGNTFLQDTVNHLQDYTVSHSIRQLTS
jgi:hypothetical protein